MQGEVAQNPGSASNTAAAQPADGRHGPDVVFFYLAGLLGVPVRYEGESRPFGRLRDIGGSAGTAYPVAVSLEVRGRHGSQFLPWSAVESFSSREVVVRRTMEAPPPAGFWSRRDVLDDQVVDVSGARVLRVNDVHLIYSDRKLIFGHADIGILGILRRLGFERPIAFLLRWLFDYSIKNRFVTWRHIEVLSPGGVPGGLRVSGQPSRLADIHPADLADLMEQLGVKDRQVVFNALPLDTAAETLEEVTPEFQRTLVSQAEPARAADILEEMPAREAADVLRDLGPDAHAIISRMEGDAAADVKTMLVHAEESAGALMDTNCVEARPEETAAEVLVRIRQIADDVEVLNHIYVLDAQRHLLGLLTLKKLLQSRDAATVRDLMTLDPVTVQPDSHRRDVARLFVKYGFRAIPVVDTQGIFLGTVRFRSVLSELSALPAE